MKLNVSVLSYLFVAALLIGCQQDAKEPVSTSQTGQSDDLIAPVVDLNSPKAKDVNPNASAEQIVDVFLKALCQGDAGTVRQLLTDKARVETEKHQLAVKPPGTAAARYEVGKVELADGGAYVNSIWLEPGQGGAEERYEIVWVLRSQSKGWRVAGMAARIDSKRELTYLNFEDPQDMLNKWEAVDTELATGKTGQDSVRVSERPQSGQRQ